MLTEQFLEQVMAQAIPLIKREADEFALVILDSVSNKNGGPTFDEAIRYTVKDYYTQGFLERAIGKARFTWRTGLPSSMGKVVPELLRSGDNPDRGGVCVGNIIVSLTARIDPQRVEQLAYQIASMLRSA